MLLNRIYVISWFGADERTQQRRREYHQRQIAWARNNNLEMFVLPQFYEPSDYMEGVNYIDSHSDHLLIQPEARNILLAHFYASDCDYAIFADNDSILYTDDRHCDSGVFVESFNRHDINDFKEVDLFFPLNPQQSPFTKDFAENHQLYKNNWVFKRNPDPKGSFVIVKNMRKHHNCQFFFDLQFVSPQRTLIPHEDTDFGFQMMSRGFSCYMLKNIVLCEMAGNSSTWIQQEERKARNLIGKELLIKKYGLNWRKTTLDYNPVYQKSLRPKLLHVPKCDSEQKNLLNNLFE